MTQFIALPSKLNMLVTGQTQSGKSYFTAKLLMHCDKVFKEPPILIIFCYKHFQGIYSDVEKVLGNRIKFRSTLPNEQELLDEIYQARQQTQNKAGHVIFVADDWMDQIYKNPIFLSLVTRIAHHECLTNIFLVQDGSSSGPLKREILNNMHANVYMASCRDRASLRSLAIQLGDYQCILQAYDDASKGGRGSYLMIVTHPLSDPNLKYRTNIFPTDPHGPVIYKSQKYRN